VRVGRRGSLAVVTLDSPHNRNALSARLVAELHSAVESAAADGSVRMIVLTGDGPAFCSGADLAERLHPQTVPARGPELADVLTAIATAPQPVVARVNGPARAGGLGLVAACDLAVAERGTTFAFAEVKVGVAPALIAVPARLVMERRALARYTLTGETFDAEAAAASGLLTEAVAEGELDEWVEARLASVVAAAPGAVAVTKRLLAELAPLGWDEALALAGARSAQRFTSPEAAEGMAAFLAKRPPSWVEPPA